MSMRAVERFIKEHMNNDSEKALAFLEAAVGKKLKPNKLKGRHKNDPVDEYFWYMLVWSEYEGKKSNGVKTTLEKEFKIIEPMIKRVNQLHNNNITPAETKYYLWYKKEKDYLESGHPSIELNLDFINHYLAGLGFEGMY